MSAVIAEIAGGQGIIVVDAWDTGVIAAVGRFVNSRLLPELMVGSPPCGAAELFDPVEVPDAGRWVIAHRFTAGNPTPWRWMLWVGQRDEIGPFCERIQSDSDQNGYQIVRRAFVLDAGLN